MGGRCLLPADVATDQECEHLLDLMNVPTPSDRDGDSLYLARPPEVGRSILNTAEVAGVLEKHGT
jgi:hypothetical protein